MPYYFPRAYDGYVKNVLNRQSLHMSYNLAWDDYVDFMDNIIGYMDIRYGRYGECENESDPKSNKNSYNIHAPKKTDKTKIGIFLRNFMDINNINENTLNVEYSIYDYIVEHLNIANLEKLFHSMSVEDQVEFIRTLPNITDILNDPNDPRMIHCGDHSWIIL